MGPVRVCECVDMCAPVRARVSVCKCVRPCASHCARVFAGKTRRTEQDRRRADRDAIIFCTRMYATVMEELISLYFLHEMTND